MKVHIIASLPHHQQHTWHVFRHLPEEMQGRTWTDRRVPNFRDIPEDDIILVGGFYDIDRARGRKVIYVEHGAGQSYHGDAVGRRHPAYHGSSHPSNVIGYVSPRQAVAESWGRPAVAVGSPICDMHADREPGKVAVFAFHWDCRVAPEARSAYEHYALGLGQMVRHVREAGFEVIACSHPRDNRLPFVWRRMHVERVAATSARDEASLIIADNTSLMYEMAHLNRSVIALNAPWYRKEVNHGLRFWDAPGGIQIEDVDSFLCVDIDDYVGGPIAANLAALASVAAYDGVIPGDAGCRAAQWIVELVEQYGRGT